MRAVLLGTGSPPPNPKRRGPATLLSLGDERFLIDAGSKAFSSDGASDGPFPGRGVVVGRPDLVLDFMSEEHGVGHLTADAPLAIGERIEVIPLHVCPAVDLFDVAYGVRDGSIEREIPIAARGRSQ